MNLLVGCPTQGKRTLETFVFAGKYFKLVKRTVLVYSGISSYL